MTVLQQQDQPQVDCVTSKTYSMTLSQSNSLCREEMFLDFEENLPLQVLQQQLDDENVNPFRSTQSIALQEETQWILSDFDKIGVLGQGQFGTVWLTNEKKSDKKYALKSISKLSLLESSIGGDCVENVIREKKMMTRMNHPFISGICATFQDTSKLYLLLPLVKGGELLHRIYHEEDSSLVTTTSGMSSPDAKFYTACILDALRYMHSQEICYRDLKPENVLIDQDGYCVLVDFGFAKIVPDGSYTYTLCGTPDYVAPEIIMGTGHNTTADYWSFGVLLFELLEGSLPFYFEGASREDMDNLAMEADFICSERCDSDAQDLIGKLLVVDPSERLGNLEEGASAIQDHPWFQEIDFGKLIKRELTAPWIPTTTSSDNPVEDVDEVRLMEDPEEEEEDYRLITQKEQDLFEDF